MICEILTVGTEILLGNIVNTHATFLSRNLADLGISVHFHQSCGDNANRLKNTFLTALNRSDIVILTGGLGPTTDDITKEVVASALNIPLEMNEVALMSIKDFFKRLNREMTHNNEKQAKVMKNCTVFHNNHGTAPGMAVQYNNKHIIILPGPPRELIPMFYHDVMGYLEKLTDNKLTSKTLRIIGKGESAVEEALGDIVYSTNPTVALYAKDTEVHLRMTVLSNDICESETLLNQAESKIINILGECVYGYDENKLAKVVVDLLNKDNLKIATAESCTGGMLSQELTSVSGASNVFECGIISYGNNIKKDILNISEELLAKYGAVSKEVAVAMALGVKNLAKSDVSVSITGIAGPTGGTDEKPVGTVHIAVIYKDIIKHEKYVFGHNKGEEREYIRTAAMMNALNMVRLLMLNKG